jgi:hypothetical protein
MAAGRPAASLVVELGEPGRILAFPTHRADLVLNLDFCNLANQGELLLRLS